MKYTLLLAIGLFGFCYLMNAQKTLPETIRTNYIRLLLPSINEDVLTQTLLNIPPETELGDQAVIELHQRYPLTHDKIQYYVETLTSDGSWPDINYNDTRRSGWEPKKHAERVQEMAKYKYSLPENDIFTQKISKTIHSAIHFWLRERPVCKNWWYNQIGVPKTWGPAFILLKDELSPEEKQGGY